jgi:hypothetical protein
MGFLELKISMITFRVFSFLAKKMNINIRYTLYYWLSKLPSSISRLNCLSPPSKDLSIVGSPTQGLIS